MSVHTRANREVTLASMSHRLHNVFHRFAEKIDKKYVQQEHQRYHGASQYEVVFAVKTADQLAVSTLEYERLDESAVLAIRNRNCNQPVLTIVLVNLSCRGACCDFGTAG